ncbi:hypothetical protein JRO89_XS11G0165300 [Xanthoceras sorbifolium]|uniref:Uncharacterized protein n=1 Tax=Xanthoceras sorbifolium TaxID=99658 RepID=A0ABQ8HFU2_9ROSI|nr:hypothetical protein JRO89_XS11G0165300 [Xanthoceras sorbifolium]
MDREGISQTNEQEIRGVRHVWINEEEEALLSILNEIIASGGRADCGSLTSFNSEGFRGKHFPLYERLANIFEDHATGKMSQTPDQQAADFKEEGNFSNEFETPENFSPMSMNQSQSDLLGNQAASQPLCRKTSRSDSRLADPIASSMNRFFDVIKEAMDKTTKAFKAFGQILATNKANEHERIAHELQKMGTRRVDQVRIMKMFVHKLEMVGIFKAPNNEENKFQFIIEFPGGEFYD